MEKQLNHFDENGGAVMVDVSGKDPTLRTATAAGSIRMNAAAFAAVKSGSAKKGDVLGAARIAGIMAAKQTPRLIPLCHPLLLEKVGVDFVLDEENLTVNAACTAQCTGKTGVEMEALCGVSVALLTIYDMCKAVDRAMVISGVSLKEKQGGRSGRVLRGEGAHHD